MKWDIIGAYALGGILMTLANFYCWYKLEDKKINFKGYRLYFWLFISVIAVTFFNYFLPPYFKMILLIVLQIIACYFLVDKNIQKCILLVIITQGITMFLELLAIIGTSFIVGNNIKEFMGSILGILIVNLIISLFLVIAIRNRIINKLYQTLCKMTNNIQKNYLFASVIGIFLLSIIFMITSHMQLSETITVSINSGLLIFYIIIIWRLMNTQDKFQKVNSQYTMSLASLHEYEDIMNRYRIDNHENKNQLQIIRNMVKAKDRGTIKYIEKLIDDKLTDNESIFYKTAKIPEGGLRAIIYSKVSKMKSLNIKYSLTISNDISSVDLINLDKNLNLDICKIIGVFLDNSIEAVSSLKKKNISISLFMVDNRLCIKIGNNYEGNLDMDKLDKAGHTTKGKGHGYGLALVKKIIQRNPSLENERMLDRGKFIQILYVSLNK